MFDTKVYNSERKLVWHGLTDFQFREKDWIEIKGNHYPIESVSYSPQTITLKRYFRTVSLRGNNRIDPTGMSIDKQNIRIGRCYLPTIEEKSETELFWARKL
jgi:hypothetical protein